MDFQTWVIFFMSYLVITLSPGPNVLLVLKNVLKQGYQSGLISIGANLFCQLVIVVLVALGVGALLETLPLLFLFLKVFGGGYLIYLGFSHFKKKNLQVGNGNQDKILEEGKASKINLFRQGCLVSISNPKTVLFLSAFLPQFLNHNNAIAPQFTLMFVSIATCVLSVHLFYAFIALRVQKSVKRSTASQEVITKLKSWLDRVTGSAFILLGGGVIFSQK